MGRTGLLLAALLAFSAAASAFEQALDPRSLAEAIDLGQRRIDLVVDLTFHPLNNYIGVPEFTVTLVAPGGARIEPVAISRAPRFGPRLSTALPYPYLTGGAGPQNGPSVGGGLVVAGFDGRALDPNGTYVVLIREGAKDMTRATVNF